MIGFWRGTEVAGSHSADAVHYEGKHYQMHILLGLSYAFSLWMIIDAYKRGAEHYWYLIIFFPLGEWVYFFMVKIHDFEWLFAPRFKCSSCRHCLKVYEDGAKCGAGKTPLFMNATSIGYCTDYSRKT